VLADLLLLDGVVERSALQSTVGAMALHGGLEVGTVQLAEILAARLDLSIYTVTQPPSLWWHIPSTKYRLEASDRLAEFVAHCGIIFSIHGYGRPGMESTVLVGGANRVAARDVGAALRASGIDVIDDLHEIPMNLRGTHPNNPVNLSRGGGVQLELGSGLRSGPVLDQIADALTPVVHHYADCAN